MRGVTGAALLAAASIAIVAAAPRAMHAQTGAIVGRTVLQGGDVALGYTMITLNPGSIEQFADADGRFIARKVPAGRIRLVARRIGYAPADTTVDVTAGDTARVRLEMRLITIRLPAVHSLAEACAHPGGRSELIGPDLALLFDQVKQNAERNRLLVRSYPFVVDVERRVTKPEPVLDARFVAYDTVRRSSERTWRYAPGNMLGRRDIDGGVFGGSWVTLTLPELADFADPGFLNNHCFDFAGLQVMDGDTLLAVDFRPAPVVRQPDVSGTLYLDPKTYQLRLTLLTLVNLTKQLQQEISGHTVRATFKEVLPGVPILDVISSAVFPKLDPKAPPTEPATETQRVLSVRFLKGRP